MISRLFAGVLLLATIGGCAAPPPAPDYLALARCEATSDALVDVTTLDPSIRTEIRYATNNNFTGAPLPGYELPRALLRPEAAAALARVQADLEPLGLGLKIWDAYRPVRATLAMVEWAENSGNEWVLDEGYVARRSGHNLGNTVDLTIVSLESGEALDMGTPYDTFSEAAHTANATGEIMESRRLLLDAMAAEGWANYEKEWWHYGFPGDFEPLDLPHACFE